MSDDVNTIIGQYEKLWADQGNWRVLWNTIAQYVLPAWDNFIGYFSEGMIRTTRIFDSTAITANERFAAAMEGLLTPRTQMWHDIEPADESLKDDAEVMEYCAQVRKRLFAARYRPKANYASQADECYMQLGAFGNNAMLIDEAVGRNLIYRSIPLNEICWSVDAAGLVDSMYRMFTYTAHQCAQMNKAHGWQLPEAIQKALDKGNHFAEFDILHCVRPNEEWVKGAIGAKGMAYASWYIYTDEKLVMKGGGYRTFPFAVGRYRMAPKEYYGRSPAVTALPNIRTINEMGKTSLRAGQKAVDPPLLLADEGALTPFNLRSGALNYGMLSSDGTPLVVPLESKNNFEFGKELLDREAGAINDSFLTTLFQILVQNPDMTATEALIRAQEKGMLIAPAMGRQQSEFIGPQIVREIDIMSRAGQLPPPPQQLLDSGKGLKVEYTNPLSKLMRAEEAQTIATSVQGIAQMASVRPTILDLVDWDATGKEYLEASGFPLKLLLPPDRLAALRQQSEAQMQAQQVAQAAPGVSTAALNLAKAHQALNPTQGAPAGGQ